MGDDNKIFYEASSPDEIALVQIAEDINMRLIRRTDKIITVKNPNNIEENYEILANFPFSSESKRMGIILKNVVHGHIIFYLKGAEIVIQDFVKEGYKSYIKENCEMLACSGLRTLVLTQKLLSQEFYHDWVKVYEEALVAMDGRKEKLKTAINLLENNMDFLCVTGVEGKFKIFDSFLDKLQDEAAETIESLRNAGIRVWMLTGDKIETATCIAISAGLKNKNQKLFYLRDAKTEDEVLEQLEKFKIMEETILILDGASLELALAYQERIFFEVTMKVIIK